MYFPAALVKINILRKILYLKAILVGNMAARVYPQAATGLL